MQPVVNGKVLGSIEGRSITKPLAASLQKLFELLNRDSSVPHNAAHGVLIHRIVARNRYDPYAVTHHNVLALMDNAEACLFEGADSSKVIYSGKLGHN